jgi:hypothetical protein
MRSLDFGTTAHRGGAMLMVKKDSCMCRCLRHVSDINACYRQEMLLINEQQRLQQDCRDHLPANVLQDGSSPRSAGRCSSELSKGEKEKSDYIDEYY